VLENVFSFLEPKIPGSVTLWRARRDLERGLPSFGLVKGAATAAAAALGAYLGPDYSIMGKRKRTYSRGTRPYKRRKLSKSYGRRRVFRRYRRRRTRRRYGKRRLTSSFIRPTKHATLPWLFPSTRVVRHRCYLQLIAEEPSVNYASIILPMNNPFLPLIPEVLTPYDPVGPPPTAAVYRLYGYGVGIKEMKDLYTYFRVLGSKVNVRFANREGAATANPYYMYSYMNTSKVDDVPSSTVDDENRYIAAQYLLQDAGTKNIIDPNNPYTRLRSQDKQWKYGISQRFSPKRFFSIQGQSDHKSLVSDYDKLPYDEGDMSSRGVGECVNVGSNDNPYAVYGVVLEDGSNIGSSVQGTWHITFDWLVEWTDPVQSTDFFHKIEERPLP
jgi:hypothetical protein